MSIRCPASPVTSCRCTQPEISSPKSTRYRPSPSFSISRAGELPSPGRQGKSARPVFRPGHGAVRPVSTTNRRSRRTPAGLLGSRVVMLARIDHIGQRPFGNPPCRIGRYHLLRPVLVDDMQLAEKPGRTVRPHPVNLRIVKAVAQHRADRVLAKRIRSVTS